MHPSIAGAWTGSGRAAVVLPDGCADVVWTDGRLVVAGPATRAAAVPATPGEARFGVRLRVGAVESALGVPADALRDLEVPLAALGRRLDDPVARAAERGATAGAAALAALLARGAPGAGPDRLVREAARRLGSPHARLADVARDLGIGERQLRRRFHRSVGYGWRTLARVQRFQRLLQAHERSPGAGLARLAADAGYADQAHMARDVRRLSGSRPGDLLATGARAAGETSGTFKTGGPADGIITA